MKNLILSAVLSACSLAAAAQNSASDTVTISAAAQKNSLENRRSMLPDEFHKFAGSYELANGKSLALFTRGLKKYAKLQDEAWHEIVATSANSFVSLDKHLEMTIERKDNGDIGGELLIRGQEPAVAGSENVEHVGIVAAR